MNIRNVRDILATISEEGNTAQFTVTEDWSQGRTTYGGLIALLAQTLMARRVIGDRQLRAMHLVYAAPNAPGEISFVTDVIREGKSVTVVRSDVVSNAQITTTVTGVYGASRASQVFVETQHLQAAKSDAQTYDMDLMNALAPRFYSHVEMRLIGDNFPYSNSKNSAWSASVRYRNEEESKMTPAHLLGLLDVLPTPALAMLDGIYPASTLTWTIELLDDRIDFDISEWWRLDMRVDSCSNGYSVYTCHAISPSGKVVAISRQVTALFG